MNAKVDHGNSGADVMGRNGAGVRNNNRGIIVLT